MVATARDLRFRMGDLLSAVSRGEEVIITFRGEPAARLSPSNQRTGEQRHADLSGIFGLWKDHAKTASVAAYVRSLRKSRLA